VLTGQRLLKKIAARQPALNGCSAERLEIGHDVLNFPWREPKQRHAGMNALRQGPLQVGNGILEMQGTKGGNASKRALAVLLYAVASSAMQANKSQPSSFRGLLCKNGFART
jgi:hypothetical protein